MLTETKEFTPAEEALDLGAELPVLALPEPTLFPGAILTQSVATPDARALVDALFAEANPHVIVALERDLAPGRTGAIAILARVLKTMGHVSGNHGLALEGIERVRILSLRSAGAYRRAKVARASEVRQPDAEGLALFERLRTLTKGVIQCMPELSTDAAALVDSIPDPGRLCDLAAANLDLSSSERLALLAALDVKERLRSLVAVLERKHAELSVQQEALKREELRQPWPFEAGAEEHLRRALADGRMTPEEADDLRHLSEKGYVVWKGLVEPACIDALLADVRSIAKHPGHFVTSNHRNKLPFGYSGPDFDTYESIFDPYVNFESVRAACFHPRILRFLELVFEARPVAFQQLLFQRSNGHPLHQDTAYVCVDKPLHMLATWIALEDVVQGRGELTYFEGSHRIPHYFFSDGSKRFNAQRDDPAPMSRHLLDQIRAHGCAKHDFLAKKGDVFVWAADLVHGSNPRTRPEVETRMSCVTHYCPETTRPFWFRVFKDHRGMEAHGERARIVSSYYRLPKGPGFVRPTFLLPERPKKGPLPTYS